MLSKTGAACAIASPRILSLLLALAIVGCGLLPPASGIEEPVRQTSVQPSACLKVTGSKNSSEESDAAIVGAEDLTIHQATGYAYVSATDRRAEQRGRELPNVIGRIWRLDLQATPPRAYDVTPENRLGAEFRPHGLSLWEEGNGHAALFVVNHRSNGTEAIEILRIDARAPVNRRLAVGETIEGPALVSPNDVAAVGPRQFYVTNDHGVAKGFRQTARDLLRLNNGNVVYFNGDRFEDEDVLALPWANGINVDRYARRIYVASSAGGTITTLGWLGQQHPAKPLSEVEPLRLGTMPDNIEFETTKGNSESTKGNAPLVVAAHPKRFRFLFYAKKWFSVQTSPSQVLIIPRDGDKFGRPTEVLRFEGDEARQEIAAASVAALYRAGAGGQDRLVLGSIFSPYILVCDASALVAADR